MSLVWVFWDYLLSLYRLRIFPRHRKAFGASNTWVFSRLSTALHTSSISHLNPPNISSSTSLLFSTIPSQSQHIPTINSNPPHHTSKPNQRKELTLRRLQPKSMRPPHLPSHHHVNPLPPQRTGIANPIRIKQIITTDLNPMLR